MKSPWQIGLLIVAIAGVSTYDIVFFRNYRNDGNTPAAMESNLERTVEEPFSPGTAGEPASAAGFNESANRMPHPAISMDELKRQAKQAYTPGNLPDSDAATLWPSRDPFRAAKGGNGSAGTAFGTGLVENAAGETRLSRRQEPQCIFSGTLIDKNRKLALIDGTPQAVGAKLGDWQLTVIGSDYIVLESGNNRRRIELNKISFNGARPKESL